MKETILVIIILIALVGTRYFRGDYKPDGKYEYSYEMIAVKYVQDHINGYPNPNKMLKINLSKRKLIIISNKIKRGLQRDRENGTNDFTKKLLEG